MFCRGRIRRAEWEMEVVYFHIYKKLRLRRKSHGFIQHTSTTAFYPLYKYHFILSSPQQSHSNKTYFRSFFWNGFSRGCHRVSSIPSFSNLAASSFSHFCHKVTLLLICFMLYSMVALFIKCFSGFEAEEFFFNLFILYILQSGL